MSDPIVEEIRLFRQEHAQRFHGNLAEICADLRQIQATCGHPVVALPPQRLTVASLRNIEEPLRKIAA